MTVIAYRDGVMAADGLMENGAVKSNCVKIAKRKGHLFGAAGQECPPIDELITAYFDLDDEARWLMKEFKFDAIIVPPSGEIQLWCEAMTFEPILAPFYAIGFADQGAMCAMEVGAGATDAVRAACKWVPGIGGRMSVRRLKG